jgi:uncharacterized protein (TIGR02598 family)
MKKIQNLKSGFTLMEVIVSIAIITTALIAAIGLISFSITSIRINKSKIIAAGLVQEGLEIVKNIRDNNWLHNCPACDRRTTATWRIGLDVGDWRVQYNLENLLFFDSVPLKIDSSGFYQYNNGSNTSFYRRVNIQYVSDDQIKVTAEVTWVERGSTQSVIAETRYYNWLKE